MNLLILYPNLFQSFSKFERKINNILSKKNPNRIIYYADPNGFIKRYTEIYLPNISKECTTRLNNEHISHAIVFDDGEEFTEDLFELKRNKVVIRRIKIKITRVINIKKEIEFKNLRSNEKYEYIGRGSYWGNPYSLYEDDDREEIIRKFKYDFDFEKFPNKEKKEVFKLAGKRLGCFCKPEACHGDILADFLNSWDDGE